MHTDELEIDECFVQALINNQCPHWASLPLKAIASSGTDHALFRLGNEFVVRLPRIQWACEDINKEYEWVPKLAEFLSTPISQPLFKGQPTNLYPWAWTVNKWNEGCNPNFEIENEYELLAIDLADFLNALHKIFLPNGPSSRRGVPLVNLNVETKKCIVQLGDEVGIHAVASLWDRLSSLPAWDKCSVWVHGDFLPGNILTENNRLSAVIDFSDVGMGDPACDLVIAWSLFNAKSRAVFRNHLENLDENAWGRGRGWAISIASIMLPYYKNSNPVLAKLARRMLENVVEDR